MPIINSCNNCKKMSRVASVQNTKISCDSTHICKAAFGQFLLKIKLNYYFSFKMYYIKYYLFTE